MAFVIPRRVTFLVAGLLQAWVAVFPLPAHAASALAAWTLSSNGVLELRTARDTHLEAFFQRPGGGKGARVWIDFPGELIRPRTLQGSGPVRQIRLGKPSAGFTRLVIEFVPSVVLDPTKLKLVGTSPDRWTLNLLGLPTKGLRSIAEGNLESRPSLRWTSNSLSRAPISSSSLPAVRRGRYRVVIDPGHGGPDSGAVGVGGLRETDVVLDISLRVEKLLKSKGVKVNLTRRREVDLDLPPRVALANRIGANAFVSIHANASRGTREEINGVETFFFSGSRAGRLAANIQQQLLKVSVGSPDRGVRRGRFFVIRRTRMPAVLVEIGFVTGRKDARRLSDSSHRGEIAQAISFGILRYLQGLY